MSDNMVGLATGDQRPNLHYDLENPETGLVYPCPEKGWRYDKATMAKTLNNEDTGKLDLEGTRDQDRGFRVFKLAESNFKPWNAEAPKDGHTLALQLAQHINHIREGRTAEDILYEILLKSGFPLTTPVEVQSLAGRSIYSVAGGALLICLERKLTLELIRAMAEQKPERVVCLDEGFVGNDQLKANAVPDLQDQGRHEL